ncbi:MAG: hypothetical protein A3E78_11705 [Alphaproteobacteria bacterium RIFCSPHIGHO2_12_FULL_63_12]|nr:MAG: hypothetical protein A3E78_11705 [Alphaproteobacteria bacterium RIFCSPHIGHO2_12_FULL_63_12]
MSGTWASAYIGLPYRANGRERDGVDCWGLVRLVLAEHAAVDVPDYGEVDAADLLRVAGRFRRDSQSGPWRRVEPDQDQAFDVVLMKARVRENDRFARVPAHCGVIVRPGFMLHIQKKTMSAIVPYRDSDSARAHVSVVHRVIGVYRHGALA